MAVNNYHDEGFGNTKRITMANPAAGAVFLYTFPAGYNYCLHTLCLRYVTSVAVGNRFITFFLQNTGGNVLWRGAGFPAMAASLTADLSCFYGAAQPPAAFTRYMTTPLPNCRNFKLNALYVLSANVVGILAADQFSLINLQYNEFAE